MRTTTTLLQDYVRSGMVLVPIPHGSKRPTRAGWNCPDHVVKDAADAAHLDPNGNVGIAHAYCGTAAIDVDALDGATTWLKLRGIDLGALTGAPDAVLIESGRPNRTKLLYRLPSGMPPPVTKVVKDGAKTLLEFRCATAEGKTVQDVLPPSIHPDTGVPYRWAGHGSWDKLPEMPHNLVMLWQALSANPAPTAAPRAPEPGRRPPETPELVAQVKVLLARATAACPYDQWRNIIWGVRDLEWGCGEQLARQWSLTAPERFTEDAFRSVWDSFQARDGGITWRSLQYLTNPHVGALPVTAASATLGPVPEWVEHLNTRFAEVRVGTRVLILDEHTTIATPGGTCHSDGYLEVAAFRQILNGRYVPAPKPGAGRVFEGYGAPKRRALATAWLAHPHRRQYQGTVFDPGNPAPAGVRNTWRGFAVAPIKAGDVKPWLRVLECVVPDPETQLYVMQWLAWKVQNPGSVPGTILLVTGGKGTGKNSLFEPIVRMFGAHGRVFDDGEQIAGRFSGHLQSVAFAVLDEALFAGDPKQNDRIKSRITATSTVYESKGRDPTSGVNRCAYVSLSNHAHVWQATVDERRAVVCEAGAALVDDREFWGTYHKWLAGDGPAALLGKLQTFRLEGFNPYNVPKGAALARQVEQTALKDPVVAWWHDVLAEGSIGTGALGVPLALDEETEVSRSAMRDAFDVACARARTRPVTWEAAMRKVRLWAVAPGAPQAGGIRDTRPRQGPGPGVRMLVMPNLKTLRAAFTAHTGVQVT